MVARYFTPPDNTDVPAIVTATVTGVLYLTLGIVHHMNQPLLLAVFHYLMGFIFGNLAGQTFVDDKFCHFIVLDAHFKAVVAIAAAEYFC